MRLLLFDVDGTLLSPGPPALRAFTEALVEVFGTAGNVAAYRFEGKLDPMIVTDLMREAGIPEAVIAERRRAALERYLDRLEGVLAERPPTLKPGVEVLVPRLAASREVVCSLLTGNVERGARIKLQAAGLWSHFAFGTWGDEAERREGLGEVALRRALERTGRRFRGEDCVVVGDSPADVRCGQALRAKVVAVATGRTAADELRRAGADIVLRDLADLREAEEALLA